MFKFLKKIGKGILKDRVREREQEFAKHVCNSIKKGDIVEYAEVIIDNCLIIRLSNGYSYDLEVHGIRKPNEAMWKNLSNYKESV